MEGFLFLALHQQSIDKDRGAGIIFVISVPHRGFIIFRGVIIRCVEVTSASVFRENKGATLYWVRSLNYLVSPQ